MQQFQDRICIFLSLSCEDTAIAMAIIYFLFPKLKNEECKKKWLQKSKT